jgi:hypothetical protein
VSSTVVRMDYIDDGHARYPVQFVLGDYGLIGPTAAWAAATSNGFITVLVIPNSGGGGANNMQFPSPLTVPAATALTFTTSASTSTVYCNAQGFTGDRAMDTTTETRLTSIVKWFDPRSWLWLHQSQR